MLRPSAAELIATFMFVFLGVGAIGATGRLSQSGGETSVILIGLAHGFGIALGVITVGRISGAHMNPAVSIAAWATGNLGTPKLVAFVIAQLAGAAAGALVATRAFGGEEIGVHALQIPAATAFGVEAVLTFVLVFTIFAVAVDPRGNAVLAPLAIGGVVAVDHFVAFPLTGASMNPARTFGPALLNGTWADHWVYWAGPIAGAIMGAVAYVRIFGDATLRRRANDPFREPVEAETQPPR